MGTCSQSPASPSPLNFKLAPFSLSTIIWPPRSFLHQKCLVSLTVLMTFWPSHVPLISKWSIFPVKELLWENCEREKLQKWNLDGGKEVRRDLWGLVSPLRIHAADARLCMKKAFSFTFLLCTLLAGEMCRAVLILKWQMCQYKTKLWQAQSFLSAWFTSHLHLSLNETEEQTDKKITSLNVWNYICCNRREDKR